MHPLRPRNRGRRPAPRRRPGSRAACRAMTRPKSSTSMCAHVPMTNGMSCSTSRMPSPSAASSSSRRPIASVSSSSRPDDGSSSRSTRGFVASARASSTRRAVPVGSASTVSSATATMPTCSSICCVMSAGDDVVVGPAAAHLRGDEHVLACREAAERLEPLERAGDAEPGPRCGLASVMSRPSSVTRPEVGCCRPVITLKSVVLPAPLGPMRPR